MKSILYKNDSGDLVYMNNIGESWILTEARDFFEHKTYDIVVAFKMCEETDSDFCGWFDPDTPPVWFCGASFVDPHLECGNTELLECCHNYLDKKENA